MHYDLPTDTPWGSPQTIKVLAEGIVIFQTATHGGIWLNPERNASIPPDVKEKTFERNGFSGWYEQDCDAKYVLEFFELSL